MNFLLEHFWFPVLVGVILLAIPAFGSWYRRRRSSRLAAEELEILRAALPSGVIATMSADQLGQWVRAGSRDFVDPNDRAVAARYLSALHKLIDRGLATPVGGIAHELTGAGYAAARSADRA